jgi:HAE1 family hydrophobic/amphiphilic exporter-1
MVEFEADADIDESIQALKDQVDAIERELPTDAEDAVVTEVDFVDQPVLTIALSGELTDFEYATLADQVEKEIEAVAGVSRVEFQGVRSREVAVVVDQTALVRYDLTLSEIISGLRNANVAFPIGQIVSDGISYNIAFEGDIIGSEVVRDVAIATRGGQPVYVRDVAIVEDGLAPANSLSRLSVAGAPSMNSITMNVYKRSGGDITKITAAVNERVEVLKQPNELLDSVETAVVLDSGDMIKKDLVNLSTSGLQTVVLVVLVLMLAIGWREGLLAGAAVPLSFLFGFIGLYFSGNTINFLSLFSLILGIGILVDSAIVMVEGINRAMKDNPTINKKEAAIAATHQFAAPLISGTLTTVAMFTGLFIVSGIIGQFIASIPFTLIFLLFASLFVAIAIVPLFAATFLHRKNTSAFEERQVAFAHKLEHWYKEILRPYLYSEHKQQQFLALLSAALVFSLSLAINVVAGLVAAPLVYVLSQKVREYQRRHNLKNWKKNLIWYPALVVVVGVSFFITGLMLPSYNPVNVTFFEQSDVDYLIVEVENPEGTVKEVTDVAVRRVEEVLYSVPEITSFSVTVGSGSQFGSGGTGEKFANIFVNLTTERERSSTEIIDELRVAMATLHDLKVTVTQPSEGPPTGSAVIVKFLGDDLSELTTLANRSAELFKAQSGVVNVETSTNNNGTEFVMELDRAKAAALGLNPATVSQIARTAVYGSEATSLTTLDEDIPVVVKLNLNNSDAVTNDTTRITTINALEQIPIQTNTGSVPLSSVITTSLRESSSAILHEDGKRVVSVTADVTDGVNAREVQAKIIDEISNTLSMSDDVILSTGGGETDESNKAFREMFAALIVGVLLMLGVLVLEFNSYLHTRYVLAILPYSLIGVLGGLAITANPLSFPAIMGFIALAGIVVNNAILLIDMMNYLRRQNPSRALDEIVLEASGNRIRPILLTTITTIIGMVPLTYAGDMWAPLAFAVMFGLLFSVVITLILIPILYLRRPGELE